MPGLPPMVAPPAEQVDDPVTATDAANAVDAVLRGVLDERLRHCRAVDPLFARELADRLAALTERTAELPGETSSGEARRVA
ncbi:hypothetical protein ABVB25_37145, partial [Streptomyces anthocyanicus]